jgi:hypothetical protein
MALFLPGMPLPVSQDGYCHIAELVRRMTISGQVTAGDQEGPVRINADKLMHNACSHASSVSDC